MADWHKLKSKTGNQEQIVASLDGIDLDKWDKIPLSREPKPNEEVIDGEIKIKVGHEAKEKGKSSINHLTLDDLTALIDERIKLSKL